MNINKKNIFQFVIYCFLLPSIKACGLNFKLSLFPASPIKSTSKHSESPGLGIIGEPIPPRNDVRILPWKRKMPQAIPPARLSEYKKALGKVKRGYNKPPLTEIYKIANQFGLHPEQIKNALNCIC